MSSVYQKVVAHDVEKGVVENAVDILKTPDDMKAFVEGYTEVLRTSGNYIRRDVAYQKALNIIRMYLRLISPDPDKYKMWSEAIPELDTVEELEEGSATEG